MAYDERLADRVRKTLRRRKGLSEKKMFGGVVFMLDGNMCCGVVDDRLMLRLGEQGAAAALAEPATREMDFTGKPMKTMVYVLPEGIADDADLGEWVGQAVQFVSSLPPK